MPVMNKRHKAEKPYLGFIQHTWVVSKTEIIYNHKQSILQWKAAGKRNVHDNLPCC